MNTKWGSKEDLIILCHKAAEFGMAVYFDVVLNHQAGADSKEKCQVIEVDKHDRLQEIGEPREIEAWFGFEFAGRGDRYSTLKYHWYHFSGTDYDADSHETGIFRVLGENKGWSDSVGKANGNSDFLMFSNLDYSHSEVQEDVKNWGVWLVRELQLKGIRFDACPHVSQRFTNEWIAHLEKHFGPKSLFLVGEYWTYNIGPLLAYLDGMQHKWSLFDAPLLSNFSRLSQEFQGDLRTVFDGSLVKERPDQAVTLVMNHDTQPGQTVRTPVEGFFKGLAYALILLRREGYPQVFYGDLYGMGGDSPEPPACGGKLADIVLARKWYAYGDQVDYFDERNCLGFVRMGTWDRPYGLACVISNNGHTQKKMAVGAMHKGELWTDVLRWEMCLVEIDDDGYGVFPCHGNSVAIFVNQDAAGRNRFGKL